MVKNTIESQNNFFLIYTTGDFPYGMAPENLVRQMSLGLQYHKTRVKVVRVRGKSYNQNNNTGVESSDLLFKIRVSNEIIKVIEFIGILFAIPISLIRNYFKQKPDVVILYGVEYFYFVLPFWILSRILKFKIIRIVTDYYKKSTIVPVWWKKPKLFFYQLQFKKFDKYLDGIVSLSNYMSDYAKKNGVNPDKVIVIPHFIDIAGFCRGKSINHNPQLFRIGYCGTIVSTNGIYDLIEAFRIIHNKYPNTELLIIGQQASTEKIKIIDLITPFNGAAKITGLLNAEDVSNALLTCNVLVNPRKPSLAAEAGFPTKLGEYFATGIPVIATRVGDLKNYFLHEQELMLVNPDQPKEIVDAIMFLLKNSNKAQEIGIKGFEWGKTNLDYKKNTYKLLEFIKCV